MSDIGDEPSEHSSGYADSYTSRRRASSDGGSLFEQAGLNAEGPALNVTGVGGAGFDPPKPEKFSGEGMQRSRMGLRTWFLTVLTYLSFFHITEAQRVTIAAGFLSGTAARQYLLAMQMAYRIANLKQLYRFLKSKFVPATEEITIRNQLKMLRQTGSASSYIAKFNELVCCLPSRSHHEDGLKWAFMDGLKGQVAVMTANSNPRTLTEAQRIAEAFDNYNHVYMGRQAQRSHDNRSDSRHFENRSDRRFQQPRRDGPVPMDIDLNNLSISDRDRFMREGRCFKCGEKGHMARSPECPKNKFSAQRKFAKVNLVEDVSVHETPNE